MAFPFVNPNSPTTIVLLVTFSLVLLSITPLYFSFLKYPLFLAQNSSRLPLSFNPYKKNHTLHVPTNKKCDIFSGEWVPNPEAPYYTNTSCSVIHEHQNCIKYGRPDSGFMKWKWKPNGCDLPVFDPTQFLEIVRNKSIAFVGDSVSRNHMESLICLLSRVEYPIDVSSTIDVRFERWMYQTYNFTIATFWSPFLVKAEEADPNAPTNTNIFKLYLDEFDEWTTQIDEFDYVIINSGRWFFHSSIYYENRKITGCHFCHLNNVTYLSMYYGYKKALKTAFRAINSLDNYKGVTILRTLAPSHFENGLWNQGGNCLRTRPYMSNEASLVGEELELYLIQLEEFNIAKWDGEKKGLKYRIFDITQAMLLRPDGHPSSYGHWPHENVTQNNDCVHWCLPGPIDTWNDFLLEILKMEGKETNKENLHPSERKMRFL